MNQDTVRLDADRIGATLDDIAEIGNRYCGGPGEAACRDYVLANLGELGLGAVRVEPFAHLAFTWSQAACTASGCDEIDLGCHPLQYTTGTKASGEAVYLGEATEADFRRLDGLGVDLAGKVVLLHSVFPFDLCGELAERGIAGLVHVCETPDAIVGNFAGALYPPPLGSPWPGRPVPYTGVTIGYRAGRELLSAMTAGRPVQINLHHDGSLAERTAENVVAEIPATGDVDGDVIVCAHYDSQAEGPCVFDNGTGLASLLETARLLAETRPRRRIVVIASAAEEIGVWGATAYAHAHAAEMEQTAAMVNLDGVASAYPAQREIWSADAGLARLAAQTAQEMGWVPDRVMNARSTFGDHAPFGDAGVPSCLIWRPDYPYYHSRGDVRELVDEHAVAQTASVSASLIHRVAQGASVPASTTVGE
jgi:hypothetical protein